MNKKTFLFSRQLQAYAIILSLMPAYAQAELVLYTSLEEFIQAAGPTDALITNSFEMTRADGIDEEPAQNQSVGQSIFFSEKHTQFAVAFELHALESGAFFRFEDREPPNATPVDFLGALSVGDIDNQEDDDWRVEMGGFTWVSAIGFEVRGNNFQNGATASNTKETLTVYTNNSAQTREFNLSALGLGSPLFQFLGVVATAGEQIQGYIGVRALMLR